MASCLKVVGITVGVVALAGLIAGLVTWGVLASRDPVEDPPELRELDWWEHTVIYQIYPRSFMDSDGDGIGDLKGITSKLEHFVDAGIGAIWMSPIFTSPMVDFGYDISNFYDIHYEYGTMEDFENLLARAHELGIKVLLDYVPNHASDQADYFVLSRNRTEGYEDFFIWADPRPNPDDPANPQVPSNWISQFGGSAWEWDEVRQQYYLHQFAVEQVDFNFRSPAVRQEMLNIMDFWLEKGVDGFRLDALPFLMEANPVDHEGLYPHNPPSGNAFLEPHQLGYTTEIYTKDLLELYDVIYDWRDHVEEWMSGRDTTTKVLLGEGYTDIINTMLYYGNERDRIGCHFPFNFDFITSLSAESNARDFVYVILQWFTYMPQGKVPNWVFGNHDNNRMPTRFRDNMVDGLNSLNMILPGVAVTYQGEEIGMRDGYVSWEDTVDVNALNRGDNETYMLYSRDPARTPYHWNDSTNAGFSTAERTWLPIAEDYAEINLAVQKEATRSHFKVYQALTALRRTSKTLSHGEYALRALSANTLVLVRYLRTHDTIALLFNVSDGPDTVDLSAAPNLQGPLTVYTSSVESTRDVGDEIPLGEITLSAGEALVMSGPPA
ncbi:Maltase 1 [Eumeta japonica]|uniref:alpha-glucosidase n=1 Tax=Eumeta variegata TaxID=151549 RepID=A0A4C1WRL6_EUMVA|nr:Maltase 1 [Eumeta japonica]